MRSDFLIHQFGERLICLKGVGKMFYQDGFPISMSITELNKKGIEVSLLHVADECLKNGWEEKTVIKKMQEDFKDSGDMQNKLDIKLIEKFCYSNYEDQREMIFNYLFKSVKEAKQTIKQYYLIGPKQ